jgi:hypothetical protein
MSDLKAKVAEWLSKQGFPLEFKSADVLAKIGFQIDQGLYLSDPVEGVLREIDVIASSTYQAEGRGYRLSLAVECKWSLDRPWIVFTSRRARPSIAASIAYHLASPFAEAILWFLAGDYQVTEAHRNVMPPRVGFGGRQAFVERNDRELFYPTIQSVVAAATALTRQDVQPGSRTDVVRDFHVVIPTIVLEGSLFEAYLEGDELKVEPLTEATVAWRGFGLRREPAFVNIVTIGALESYGQKYFNYAETIGYWSAPLAKDVAKAGVSKDARDLPSGRTGPKEILVPWLLTGMV